MSSDLALDIVCYQDDNRSISSENPNIHIALYLSTTPCSQKLGYSPRLLICVLNSFRNIIDITRRGKLVKTDFHRYLRLTKFNRHRMSSSSCSLLRSEITYTIVKPPLRSISIFTCYQQRIKKKINLDKMRIRVAPNE